MITVPLTTSQIRFGMSPKLTVLTREAASNAVWATALTNHKLAVYQLPCIETIPLPPNSDSIDIINCLGAFSWLVFTSVTGADSFIDLLESQPNVNRLELTRPQLAAVGSQTAAYLRSRGLVVTFTPSRPDAATLAKELPRVKSRQVLLVQSTRSGSEPAATLSRRGAHITQLPVYATRLLTDPDPTFTSLLQNDQIARILFASPSATEAFWHRLDPHSQQLASSLPIIAIGPVTAQALQDLGFTHIKTSLSPHIEALLKLI